MIPTEHVPCNGCTACCRGEMILLMPGDDQSRYWTQIVVNPITGQPGLAVAKKPDRNECIYLGEGGCTIHDRAPAVCRAFDCRRWVLGLGDRAAIRRGLKARQFDPAVVQAGRERLASLPQEVA